MSSAELSKAVEENAGLIARAAKGFYGRGDPKDIYQTACLGFVKAFRTYDAAKGASFSTYAFIAMTGEIKHALRDSGAVKVSRALLENHAKAAEAQRRLASLSPSPRLSEIAREAGLSLEETAEAISLPTIMSLEQNSENAPALSDVLPCPNDEEGLLDKISLCRAVSLLSPKQKAVISMRYYRGLTQRVCAGMLGLSQTQISRIERTAIRELRKKLDD